MIQLPFFDDFFVPAGLITYPLTFLLSDLATEIYGSKKAKLIVYIALGMNLLTLGILQLSLIIPSVSPEGQKAYQAILGLSGIRTFSSLIAYLVAQIADIQIYAMIKRWTGARFLWVRANGSTWISQLIDTVLIDLIFLCWGMNMSLAQVLPIMVFSFCYKAFFSVANTPFFYLGVYLIKGKLNSKKTFV